MIDSAQFFILVGTVASIALPLFNIPLVLRIIHKKSSQEVSLVWLWGVWSCILLLTPSALISKEIVFKIFGFSNLLLFSAVVFVVMKYRRK
ncbi:MAG: hypothetical protein A3G33_01575 [Omnitrophica bacterium RIFCSPLOWO2_12_FULL_44_17]|uniref:PQ-loop repeat-containing protein n=1 Tax=Candidatus Danuiimicrobium aquiferis TaxID=1801832 RepID=A0A1G1KV08_9BACT|nr:MAG: hypothetical protein A3B72_00810 [Omnitrophica bacterium RIFCSPHIGHO2_02_FULL_45_28]OGW92499.1 MAG: hypothetical protein A3E74_09270 [Omnitrophica bacterium RIFCSPHIGHO2_12_FULL_44_12]OGW96804.1 MAG: hypothetical protein A3G33_01575 [Omnitrophica bacterium RIFCSPLOWO2_12_FULL_44_17]OGX03806.1 MAG: hypothetical protein A3J12_09465 [Omnitrophica bacterium RIFCSPLOWO2_02_FULL_44_11]